MRRIGYLLPTAVLLSASVGHADYLHLMHSGQSCSHGSTADLGDIGRDYAGTGNASTAASKTVYCPLTWQIDNAGGFSGFPNPDVNVYYIDANSDKGTGTLVGYFGMVNDGGTTWTSAPRYSCSTAGGCSSASAYSGSNYLSFSYVDIYITATVVSMYTYVTLPRAPSASNSYVAGVKTIQISPF